MANPKVLVVDDNEITRKLVRVTLAAEGCTVFEAEDGRSGLQALSDHLPDLILQDLLLPDIGGIELVRQMRRHPAGADIPIIAVSGFQSEMTLAERLHAGFTDFLFKPVEPSLLAQVVLAYLAPIVDQPADAAPGGLLVVADDDPVQLKLTRLRLQHLGFEVVTAVDGIDALEKIRARQPAAIVSDVLMPEMDGFRLCQAVRSDASLAHIPVVLASSVFITADDRELAQQMGASDLVMRTPDSAAIVNALTSALDQTLPAGLLTADAPTDKYARQIMRQLGTQTDQNLKNLRHVASLQTELAILAGLSDLLASRLPLDDILRELLNRCLDGFGLSSGALILPDEVDRRLKVVAALGVVEENQPFDSTIWSDLVHSLEPIEDAVVISDRDEKHCDQLGKLGVRSVLVTPLLSNDRSGGAMVLASEHTELDQGWSAFAQGMAHHMSSAITRAQSRARLLDSEERFRASFEQAAIGKAVVGLDGKFLQVNPAFCELLGYSRQELLSKTFQEISHPDEVEIDTSNLRSLLAGRIPTYQREERYLHQTGRIIWGGINVAVQRDQDQKPLNYLAELVDITSEKQADLELLEQKARLEEAERVAHLGHWIWDMQADRLIWSDEIYRIFGLEPGSAKLSLTEGISFLHPDDRAFVEARIERAANAGEPFEVEARIVRRDGHAVTVEIRGAHRADSTGSTVAVQGTLQDITDRKQTEDRLRQAQKMEAIGLLAGGIAHDFNNLLTAILGFTDLIVARLPESGPTRGFAEEVLGAAQRATNLTRQLLAFSRQQVLQPKPLDLNDAVGEMGKLLQRVIGEDIELRIIADGTAVSILADPSQVEQVIMNLAVNARDAMPHGGKLTIETRAVNLDETYASLHGNRALGISEPGRYAMLAVTDTGTGMDQATQDRIFEPFFTTKDVGKGTGLGLSTVYGIVKQSAGDVWVNSELGQGTTFTVFLPLTQSMLAEEGVAPAEVAPGGTETLLVVEDETGVRSLIRALLESSGYRVMDARTSEQALVVCAEHDGPIDLLVTDIVLPGMNGRELSERLATTRPDTKTLYMSGYTSDVAVRHGVLHAEVAFLQKPFTSDALLRKVRDVLDAPTTDTGGISPAEWPPAKKQSVSTRRRGEQNYMTAEAPERASRKRT